MTDNEIIKALTEWSERGFTLCNVCMPEFARHILGLINRQQATIKSDIAAKEICAEVIGRQDKEIERLQNILLRFMDEVAKWEYKHGLDVSELPLIPICDERRSIIDHYRSEAIKEFAERLKARIDIWVFGYLKAEITHDIECAIDNLVKEMAGE